MLKYCICCCILNSQQVVVAIENYLRILHSSLLSDLGIVSQSNVMTNAELFKRLIRPIDYSFRADDIRFSGNMSKIDTVSADMSSYSLPFTSIQSTQLNIPYLCHYRAWKTQTNLMTDVSVATLSFFMVFWAGFNLALGFVARRTSIDGEQSIMSFWRF